MKNTHLGALAVAALLTTGCYNKWLVMQAEAVSMTKTNSGSVKKLKEGAEVNTKWCIGDKPVFTEGGGDPNRIGLADQVIYKAQTEGGKADFITDARIFRDTDNCALLTGKKANM